MRVITWNMAYWSHRSSHAAAWRLMLEELKPDLLLVQEAVLPDWVRNRYGVLWNRSHDTGNQIWGTGIVTPHSLQPVRIDDMDQWLKTIPCTLPKSEMKARIYRADNWFASAQVELPVIGSQLVCSVHSPAFPIERQRLQGVDVSRMKLKKNPNLWFLDVVFHFLKPRLSTNLIVGGDFNSSRLLDTTLGERGNNEFFDRVEGEGFVSLHRRFHQNDEQTYFKAGRAPHQLDYLYADSEPASRCCGCQVLDHKGFSDHAPLMAEFS